MSAENVQVANTAEWADQVADHLTVIEDRLLQEAQGETEFVSRAAAHIIAAGESVFGLPWW